MRQSPLMLGVTFMLMFGAQVAAASGSSFDVPIELVKPEVAAARVAACGFKSTRPRFDHTPVHGVAIIKDGALDTFRKGAFSAGKLDDETLRCLLNAATASGYPLGFVSNELYQHRP
jgi:hypothetical protein